MEMERVPQAGYKIVGLPVRGLIRPLWSPRNIGVMIDFLKSRSMVKKIIRDFNPNAVVGVGGYASSPTLNAAHALGIPCIVQEQNSYAGVTNKSLAKKAVKICVAYHGMERFFPKDRIVMTGNPVRQALLGCKATKAEARAALNLLPSLPTLLVIGGSLGGAVGMLFATFFPDWQISIGSFVLVGMVAFFGCAAKTPISTILMIGEMTGNYKLLVPSMWVCIIAYMLSRKVSLYRSQLPNRFEAPVHRSSLVSGTLGAFTVKDILNSRPGNQSFLAVDRNTPLSMLVDRLSSSKQEIFPVVGSDQALVAVVAKSDLSTVLTADPIFRQTMLLDDLTLKEHPVVFENEHLRSVLAKMDIDNAEGIVVVSSALPRRPLGILTHNDIAAAYQLEMSSAR